MDRKHVCRSRRHRWSCEDCAKKCCNGWTLVYVPATMYAETGCLELRLVPDGDRETIAMYSEFTPAEEASSTPLEDWWKTVN